MLVIGLEPSLIDFSEKAYDVHPGLNAEVVRAGLERSKASLVALGFDARLCMIDFGETAERVIKEELQQGQFDCVVIGAGLRLNIVHERAPGAKLCFTGVLREAGVRISMDGRGRWMDCEYITLVRMA